ncbi:MAG: hypothetical protein NZ891_03090 [bacterium]|nr:hypothetical protein [bacterium]MDW8163710.1 hypothetical protein [Candidatus Omnitrophota bacterium]
MKKDKLILDVLEKSEREIRKLKEEVIETSKLFYLGYIEEGLKKIRFFSEVFSDFSFFWSDVFNLSQDEELYNINIKFSDNISNITDAIEKKDFILIGDLFHFSFPEVLERYIGIIPKIKEKIKGNGKGT